VKCCISLSNFKTPGYALQCKLGRSIIPLSIAEEEEEEIDDDDDVFLFAFVFTSLISTLLTFSNSLKIPLNFLCNPTSSSSCRRRNTFAQQFCLIFICFSSRSNFSFSFNFFANKSFSIPRLVSFLAFLSIASPFCLTSCASTYFFCFVNAA